MAPFSTSGKRERSASTVKKGPWADRRGEPEKGALIKEKGKREQGGGRKREMAEQK